ncbi:MAG: hypothetical protein BWY76_00598 [bacterium ADurb.Bin429]|nr:MAG: hypothetical protein BWY76_00598 [bacterium ADurb.Bin429]
MPDLLARVRAMLDALIAAGEPYDGLFPSLLNRETGAMLTEMPEPIPGQRNGDRAHQGSNLMHDEPALATLYAVSAASGERHYAEAADSYLRRFATHCTDTATGLFPWGEHSFWHLTEDRVGNSYVYYHTLHYNTAIHDHLRAAPLWLWEKLWALNPHCVERFAEGLEYHWVECEPREYIRHAPIEERVHPMQGARSCDFPRHSGFYLFDLSYALRRTGRADFEMQMWAYLDYWWLKRDARGLLQIESRSPEADVKFFDTNAPGQTLSLATSLLEGAELLETSHPALVTAMRERAGVYLDGFFAAPHDPEHGVFLILSSRGANEPKEAMPIWGSRYGLWPAAYVALTCLCAYRLMGDDRLLRWAVAVGRQYAKQPFPADVAAPAMDAGLGLGLLADLYAVTGERRWLDAARRLAGVLLPIYGGARLPRGAAGIGWYESQMGPGFLLHGLARTALLAEDRDACPLAADYTAR